MTTIWGKSSQKSKKIKCLLDNHVYIQIDRNVMLNTKI